MAKMNLNHSDTSIVPPLATKHGETTLDPSHLSPSRLKPQSEPSTRLAELFCWIGIIGLILVVSSGAWAETPSPKTSNPKESLKESIKNARRTRRQVKPKAAVQGAFDDIDDDSDSDTDDASRSQTPPRVFSAGGAKNTGPGPTRGHNGISVGGSSANGVITSKQQPLVQLDSETAEGSNDIVTDFNFPNADILDIAKTLGKLTGKNFILDKDVKGKITIISNSSITVSDAWKAFLTALDMNGFAMIPSGKYIRIARQRDARDKQLKTYTGETSPDTDALITRVFQLKYISAEEVARTFRSFVPANARIIPYEQTNTVIVTDTGTNISKLSKMLEILDVEGYDAGIEVIPVKYASAAELSKLIDALIPGTSRPAAGAAGARMPRFTGGSGGKFSARRTKEGGIINTIIADERTNTLIVHANTRGADQVRMLVTKLDQRLPSSTGGGKVHVVYLQFADAEQVAGTLNNFSSQTSTAPKGGASAGTSGTGANPIASTLFQGSIKIAPDKSTNALVITASPADYITVKRVIDRLDIPRDQVYVEVVIMEVAIGRNMNTSANFFSAKGPSLFTSASDVGSLFTTGPFSSNGAVIPFASGGNTTINIGTQPFTVPSIGALVKLIQTHSDSNILATPQIIALDNTEATFESAEKLPTLQSTAVQGAGVQSNIVYVPVALSIKIKPQINKLTNFVKLDVLAKLGDVSSRVLPKGVQDQAFPTTDRTAQTTVVVGDSDTVVLGGLIKDKVTEDVTKIPILGDIPILGWLFKSKVSSIQKSNLLIFMTPHIVRQYEKIRAILDKKLRERDEFIESSTGEPDPLKGRRDDMIRSLPDLKELTSKKPVNSYTIDDDVPDSPGNKPAVLVPSSYPGTHAPIETLPDEPQAQLRLDQNPPVDAEPQPQDNWEQEAVPLPPMEGYE